MNHEPSQTDKTVKLKRFGEPKGQAGRGSPKVLLFLHKDRKVRGNGDFFLVRLVKTYCKKNYFLLQ